jgi:hypothetical protein
MARPAVEWPIPTYVVEYRERILVSCRVPGRALSAVAAPIVPELIQGRGIVTLALANGRCLKTVGGAPVLAAEFHTAELTTPVRRRGACRAAQQGIYLLRFLSDSHGLCRLVETALRHVAEQAVQEQGAERDGYRCRLQCGREPELQLRAPRPAGPEAWPAQSLFADQEQAEAILVRPEWYFAADCSGSLVRAIPVHFYARSTDVVPASLYGCDLNASALGIDPAQVELDHVLVQKRCTHTWMFPPERIATTRDSWSDRPRRSYSELGNQTPSGRGAEPILLGVR